MDLNFGQYLRFVGISKIIMLPWKTVSMIIQSIDRRIRRRRNMTVVEESSSSLVSFPRSLDEQAETGRQSSKLSLFSYLDMDVEMQYIMLEARDNPVNQSAGSSFFSSRINA